MSCSSWKWLHLYLEIEILVIPPNSNDHDLVNPAACDSKSEFSGRAHGVRPEPDDDVAALEAALCGAAAWVHSGYNAAVDRFIRLDAK